MGAEPGKKGNNAMPVVLYLLIAVLTLAVSIAYAIIVSGLTEDLRLRDLQMDFENERQHALLGRCVEWSGRLAASGWMLVGGVYAVIFLWTLMTGPLREGWLESRMPDFFACAAPAASVAVIAFLCASLRKVRSLRRQYDGILAGNEPDWAEAVVRPSPRLIA